LHNRITWKADNLEVTYWESCGFLNLSDGWDHDDCV